jgi:hypothetical protein
MDEEFYEGFLRANANADYMGATLSDLVRRIMRASINGDGTQRHEAVEALSLLLKLISRSENVTVYDIVEKAAADLKVEREIGSIDDEQLGIAEDATRYLLEMSCTDGPSAARAANRWRSFESSLRFREEMKKHRRKKFQEDGLPARDHFDPKIV